MSHAPGQHEDVDVPSQHEYVDVPSRHEDVGVDFVKPEENVVSIGSVAICPVCLVAEDVHDDFSLKLRVDESSQDVGDVHTFDIPDNPYVDARGQSSEDMVLSVQSTGDTILDVSQEQQEKDSDTQGNLFCCF
ncbi:hypothetical protein D1007_05875 [Hordeum vulgare]|nr:hypothetical protein D1007_05875 [Hordeum vulgare]